MKARTNDDWIRELQTPGETQASAMADLRAYLLRASLFALQRGPVPLPDMAPADVHRLAEDCAQEALVAILGRLSEFRSEAQFTTWAYRFAVNKALVAARHRHWKDASLDELLDQVELPSTPVFGRGDSYDPDHAVERTQVWEVMRGIIQTDLSPRQRQVLRAAVFEEVPLDEVARHLGTSRNAIYKMLHDARTKIKATMEARGLSVKETLALFGDNG